MRGGGLDHVLAGRGEQEQVDVAGVGAGVGEQFARGGGGDVGRLPVVGHDMGLPYAGQPGDEAGRRAEAGGGGGDEALGVGHGAQGLRQVYGDSGEPGVGCGHGLVSRQTSVTVSRSYVGMTTRRL